MNEGITGRVNTLGSEAQREPKAVILMDRIRQMERTVDRLANLRNTILDGNVPRVVDPNKMQDNPATTLSMLLNDGAEILNVMHHQMEDIIAQIESELF